MIGMCADMKHSIIFFIVVSFVIGLCVNGVHAYVVLEPFTYSQDFESGELNAWASYPLWQDTAYDPNFGVSAIVQGDPNLSVVQKIVSYSSNEWYAGAQKKLDMYLEPGATLSLRYYLKTHQPFEFLKIRLASGESGKVDYTIAHPPANTWVNVTLNYHDFITENPWITSVKAIKVHGVAVLVKVSRADPDMPFYIGLDDITIRGSRAVHFRFVEPFMHKMQEWKPYIPARHYKKGDDFIVRGQWPLDADRVTLILTSFTDRSREVKEAQLHKEGDQWSVSFPLLYTEGLYYGTLRAYKKAETLSETEFTVYIAPDTISGKHPRVWFDSEGKKRVEKRLKSKRFSSVYEDIVKTAATYRETMPVDSVFFDIDQFPDENWVPTLSSWSWGRIHSWSAAFLNNALVYAFENNRVAGFYAKELMLKTSSFPYLIHPWMKKTASPYLLSGSRIRHGHGCGL